MRKLNYLFVALMTMLLVASCSQDETLSIDTNSNEAMVSFNLELPDSGPQTRAIGDGMSVDELVYQVFQLDANEETEKSILHKAVSAFENTKEATVNLSLLKGKSYKIAFWAQKSGTEYYNTNDLTAVTVKYEGNNNDESRDAFFAAHPFTVTSDASIDVVLNRPFAQINVGVTKDDFTNAKAAGLEVTKSKVVIKNAANKINLLTGKVDGGVEVKYTLADIPADSEILTAAGENYKYLSMSYILVVEEKSTLEDLTYVFSDGNGESVELSQGLTSVPVQRNYRTNIVGKLLTGDIDFNITIDEIFETPDYNVTTPTVTTAAELEAALSNPIVTHITIEGTLGDDSHYTIYEVDRPVTIIGGGSIVTRTEESKAKVFGTFMVKADDVTIENLAIQNQGDVGGNQLPSPQVRGNIVVWAKNVTIKNNTLTHGLGDKAGLANAIQIFSSVANNPLSNYVVEGNNIEGFENGARGSSSAAILIAEGYESTIIGKKYAENIIASKEDYEKLLADNTLTDNKIDLTHQNWGGGLTVLYPILDGNAVATANLGKFPLEEDGSKNEFYGNVSVDLNLNHEGFGFDNVTDLKIELFNGENLLATNTLIKFESTGNSITSPFLTGRTEDLSIYAWKRGAYPLKGYIPTAEELPTKVVATYVLNGQTYMSETNVTVEVPKPTKYEGGALTLQLNLDVPSISLKLKEGETFSNYSALKINLYSVDSTLLGTVTATAKLFNADTGYGTSKEVSTSLEYRTSTSGTWIYPDIDYGNINGATVILEKDGFEFEWIANVQ